MADLETVGNGGGVILDPPPKRAVPSKRWCFTLNNPNDTDLETLVTQFKGARCDYIVDREVGEEGTPHLQGYIESPVKIRPIEKFKTTRVHWEKCKGTKDDNIKYCSKDGDFVTSFDVDEPLDLITEDQLYDWQREIVQIIEQKPDKRTIHWYWEAVGGVGKTEFVKYLCHHYGAVILEGKKADVLYCAAEHKSKLYLWDLERSMEDYVSYASLEKIKNGLYMCAKYESKPIIRNNPHVFVFANFPPEQRMLSADRWNIVQITKPEAA